MLGKLLSGAIKLVTLPVDAVEIGLDMMTGGSGNRRGLDDVLPLASKFRDKVCDAIEEIDK